MKERPILFSGAMVRALLDGSKTQTRRACKPMNSWVDQDCREVRIVDSVPHHFLKGSEQPIERLRSPYGQPGDRLWVRETFLGWWNTADQSLSHVAAFRADGYELDPGERWTPSLHMPRKASRIDLEITGVRVERLQDISDRDAIAEGIRRVGPGWERWHPDPDDTEHTGSTQKPRLSYMGLCESINGAGSWEANPWVWAIEFRRIS